MFIAFKKAIQKQFAEMQKHELYRVQVSKDDLWTTYLGSFAAGTDPMFKERTEHDCNACKSFIRAVGGIVAIIDGKMVSIWDVTGAGEIYQPVADALSKLVKAAAIDNFFLRDERTAGVDKNFAQRLGGGQDTYEHFFVNIPTACVKSKDEIGTILGDFRTTKEVMHRGLTEISLESINQVLELIAQNSLYRGEEHQFAVREFLKLKKEFDQLREDDKDLFCWLKVKTLPGAVSKIRGTSVGILLVNLSGRTKEDGTVVPPKDIEDAVKEFEAMVAPPNYKHPTAPITKGMIDNARDKVEALGLVSALGRRFAVLPDVTVNNVLFADRDAKAVMGGSVFDELSAAAAIKPKNFDKVEEISIENFIEKVLPTAKSIEVMFENRHAGNLVSLIAPEDATAKSMFKWPSSFGWAYKDDVADSMRQRVTELGGRVDGALRFTHSWNRPEMGRNASLMDLHVFMPGTSKHEDGCHDRYPVGPRVGWNHRNEFKSGGSQDVDYTDAAPEGYIPIENISFPDIKRMPEGEYTFKIHNWSLRQPTKSGFNAEIEFAGQIFHYAYAAPLKNKEWVTLAVATLNNGVFTIEHKLTSKHASVQHWNLLTGSFQKVNVMMMSPNHWDGHGVGNRHYFFFMDGCINDTNPRGFFNEFLSEALTPHRKVFEVLGSKMKVADSPDQLSGLGFSSTQRNDVVVRVKGAMTRVLKITF